MLKIFRKSIIILTLIITKLIFYIIKTIYRCYKENKDKIDKYLKGFYVVLKEEISK